MVLYIWAIKNQVMNQLSDYFFKKYFKCQKQDKTYWFNMYLKAYFKEQKLK